MTFPITDTVGAWVPHGRFVVAGADGVSFLGQAGCDLVLIRLAAKLQGTLHA